MTPTGAHEGGALAPPRVLTIGGSDSGGAAGLEADLRTLALCGTHGCAAVTAVTVQNTLGVSGVHLVPPETVADQVRAVVGDIGVGAAKTGMLATAGIIAAVAAVADEVGLGRDPDRVPLVVDPVAASMAGEALLDDPALDALRRDLLPRAALATPNLDEVRLLTGHVVHEVADLHDAAAAVHALGPRWALVKGGHLRGTTDVVDVLTDGTRTWEFDGPRVDTPHLHGAGDTLASATCAALARGWDVPDAVALGERVVRRAVDRAHPLGAGTGPVSPLGMPDPFGPARREG